LETWAAYYGLAAEEIGRQGTTLFDRERLAGSGAVHLVHVGERTLAEIDPGLRPDLEYLLASSGADARLSAVLLRQAWGDRCLLSADAGHVFHLDPADWARPEAPAGVELRPLGEGDRADLDRLKADCAPDEVDDAFVETDHEIAFGCFAGSGAVCAGSGYRRNGFMDLGILTHPGHRRRGLASSVVAALSGAAIAAGWIPLYRCDQGNLASKGVAGASAFTWFFGSESLRLRPWDSGRPSGAGSIQG
jgi:GNAT superfamily N-acetyltransferase